ncbi:unnamed protein product [Hymenolepis diminuta]|uniref:Uncharacterized protein n=1 Tax=Hymenolepis diminuta TaxID=6216 RepID=A0A564ZB81_HYMDI|nr:unnamed protein product [Hymenolepis diminuta]
MTRPTTFFQQPVNKHWTLRTRISCIIQRTIDKLKFWNVTQCTTHCVNIYSSNL